MRLSCRSRGCLGGGFIVGSLVWTFLNASLTADRRRLHGTEEPAQFQEAFDGDERLPKDKLRALWVEHPDGQYDANTIRPLADDFVFSRDLGVGCYAHVLAKQRVPAVVHGFGLENVCIM